MYECLLVFMVGVGPMILVSAPPSMQSYLRPNQTEFKPSFINSPDSAEAAEESLANGNSAQLLCQPIKDHQFKPAKGGVNELCVCYSPIPLTLALFLPLYSSFPGTLLCTKQLSTNQLRMKSLRACYRMGLTMIWSTIRRRPFMIYSRGHRYMRSPT